MYLVASLLLWWKARYSMELPETQGHWERLRWVSRVRHTDTWECRPGHRKHFGKAKKTTQENMSCAK